MGSAICGEGLDLYLGVPSPKRPRCANGHRERYMEYRSRIDGFRCMKCRREISWQDNIDSPHNDWYRARCKRLMKSLDEYIERSKGVPA